MSRLSERIPALRAVGGQPSPLLRIAPALWVYLLCSMWLAGFGLCMGGVARAFPHIVGMLHGPYGQAMRLLLLPQDLYGLPSPMRCFGTWLQAHRDWCTVHRGITSLAAWRPMDPPPWHFFGALLGWRRSGTVQPMELPQLTGQLCFQLRWNAYLLGPVAPDDLHLYYKEARQQKVCVPDSDWHHYRYYPAERWVPKAGTCSTFHCTTTKGGRSVVCEGVW